MPDDTKEQVKWSVFVVAAAILGGGGTSTAWTLIRDPRPDPFTGTEGRALEKRIVRLENYQHNIEVKLDNITERLIGIEQHLKYWNIYRSEVDKQK